MDFNTREFYVNRICAGLIKLRVCHPSGDILFFCKPTIDERYYAEEVYRDVYEMAMMENNFTDEEMEKFIYDTGLWTATKEADLTTLKSNLEKLKTKSISMGFNSEEISKVKQGIQVTKSQIKELEEEKSAFSFLTCHGVAAIAKTKFLIGCSLFRPGGQKIYNSLVEFWQDDDYLLNLAMEEYIRERLSEVQMRELARTEPWRTIWNCSSNRDLFGRSVVEYTDEQKGLSVWSKFYDSIYENPERPSMTIINDDDFLDGWVLLQKQKSEKDDLQKKADGLMGDKVKDAQEVYLPAGNSKDAANIDDLNDGAAKYNKQRRMAKLMKEGQVHELEMPDTKQRLRTATIEKLSKHMRGVANG